MPLILGYSNEEAKGQSEQDNVQIENDSSKVLAIASIGDGQVGLINIKDEWVLIPDFTEMYEIKDTQNKDNFFIAVKGKEKWGIVDKRGAWIKGQELDFVGIRFIIPIS
jgi:hypothetical protein